MGLHPDFLRLPISHRGLHSAGKPENSMAAFRAAIASGFGIECDIQAAADGTPVVFHDDDLTRLTGAEGLVRALGIDMLSMLRIMGTDEPIPTLAELLAEVAGRVPLLIEIKDQSLKASEDIGDLSERVAGLVAGYTGPVAVMSFNPHSVATLHKTAPDVPVGLTTCGYEGADWPDLDPERREHLAAIADFERIGASFVSHDHNDLDNPAVAALKNRGIPVLTWTIRTTEEEKAARRVADNITFEGYLPEGR
ncbi:glycerophosphodiester phosphodiesterase family protein [Paracoccus sp. MBLB3053]|uniref:Glycerophosphodiester phosphodiesterase family protein n=1 Tax=Paracoccus aurantius TaxID=3073814 RepID=A0ABU2HNU2_9RHOB|nr:glycerophosphodiester phosphodiesterase family protein [Paracoccus sp. MBLB3053]MDS9466706.1 glycerophosphodiester phosphodiesterase family protein [Paracoccus sp. MBLB3053]